MPIPDYVRNLRQNIGNGYLLLPAVSIQIFDDAGRILLGRRSDTGKWATVGGIINPDESPAQTAVREAMEELGVEIEIERVAGVYGLPRTTYPNGDLTQYVTVSFRCHIVAGTPRVNDEESLDVGWFALDALPADLSLTQRQRIDDASAPGRDLPAKFGGPGCRG